MKISITIEEIRNIFKDIGFTNSEEINEGTYILGKKSDFSSIETVSFFSSVEEIYSSHGFDLDLFELLFNDDDDEPPELTIIQLLQKISKFTHDK